MSDSSKRTSKSYARKLRNCLDGSGLKRTLCANELGSVSAPEPMAARAIVTLRDQVSDHGHFFSSSCDAAAGTAVVSRPFLHGVICSLD